MIRTVVRVAVQAVLASALTVVFGWLFLLVVGNPPPIAWTKAITDVLLFVDIGIATWVVLLIVGAVRRRGVGWGIKGSMIAALIGALVNLLWIVILSAAGGGVDAAALGLGVQAGVLFLIAALAASIAVHPLSQR